MIAIAIKEDAPALNELVNSAFRGDSSRQGWTTEADLVEGVRIDTGAIEEMIGAPSTILLKYSEGDEIIGCVELKREGDKSYLGMLTVQPGLQGKGIGKQLLYAAEDESRRQGCHAIYMTVISVRAELIAWYIRHGYHDTGKRKPFRVPDARWGASKTALEFAFLEKSFIH